uniref:peptidylprolyl isomerase n=1 Tax=Phallusia mammillata TaxID=59560 RepID=A0A6F9DDN7_9ASCI|nr:inactive peptidyl-prolyl cis-trans isomerase FKBP6 [Phallusia mammillata]
MNCCKLLSHATGSTFPLKEGINIEELRKANGQEFELSLDDLDESLGTSKQYFDDVSKFSFLLDDGLDEGADDLEDVSWFKRILASMVNVTDDGGVKKSIKKEGVGMVVTNGARVSAHYSGYLEDLDEPFDSSQLRNRTLQINLGNGEVIPGLDIGISTMRKHEIARFYIEPAYAYGLLGCPPRIPPKTPIVFEVELISFTDNTLLDNFDEMSREEKQNLSFERVLAVIKEIKIEGNQLFAQQNYLKAIKRYMRIINILETVNMANREQEEECLKFCQKAYLNMALCNLKLGNFGKAMSAGKKVLDWHKENPKALYICGKSLRHMGEFAKSRSFLLRAHKHAPTSKDVVSELKILDQFQVKFSAIERQMCEKMFLPKKAQPMA